MKYSRILRTSAVAFIAALAVTNASAAVIISQNWETGAPPAFPTPTATGPQGPATFNGWTSSTNTTQAPIAVDLRVIWWWGGTGAGNPGARTLGPAFGTRTAIVDSDFYGGNDGINTNQESTVLTSPSFSTVGFASGNVSYDFTYRHTGTSPAAQWALEFSTDGGTTWATIGTETGAASLGTTTGTLAPVTRTPALPAGAIGQPDVRIRWRFNGQFGWYALVDNIVVNGINQSITMADVPAQAEGNSGTTAYNFPITISPAPASNITIDYAVVNGTTNASDFGSPTSGTFTFIGDGVTTLRNLTIPVAGDTFPEANETFSVVLSNNSAGDLIDGTATSGITDDDFVCGTVETFTGTTGTTPPAGWTNASLVSVPADLWHFDNPGGRTALTTAPFAAFDSDFLSDDDTAEDSVLTSPAMDFSAAQFVNVKFKQCFNAAFGGRAIVEASTDGGATWPIVLQDSIANIGNTPAGTFVNTTIAADSLGGSATAKIRFRWQGDFSFFWLVDDVQFCTGSTPPGTSVVAIGNASAAEGAGTLNIPISVNPANAANIDVNYTITPGTATNPADFSGPLSGTVTVTAPATSASIPVTLVDDSAVESAKSFTVNVTSLAGGASVLGTSTATGTITNDDVPADTGFGYELSLDRFSYLSLATGTPTTLASPTAITPLGGDFNGTATSYFLGRQTGISTVSPLSGAESAVLPVTGMPAGHLLVSLSHNPADGLLWAATLDGTSFADTSIGTINTTTGAYTNVSGLLTNVTAVALAHDQTGVPYFVDATVASPFSLRLFSYTAPSTLTSIGAFGAGFASLQFLEADIDPQTNILYMPICNTDATGVPTNSAMYMINKATGVPTMVGSPYATTITYPSFGVLRADAAAVENWESH